VTEAGEASRHSMVIVESAVLVLEQSWTVREEDMEERVGHILCCRNLSEAATIAVQQGAPGNASYDYELIYILPWYQLLPWLAARVSHDSQLVHSQYPPKWQKLSSNLSNDTV
jgi:hypothetical protein